VSGGPVPWRTIAVLALAANLGLIGAIVGAVAAGGRFSRDEPQAPAVTRAAGASPQGGAIRAALADLPEAERQRVRRALGQAFLDARPLRREARQAREGLRQAVAAEPFDPAAMSAAFARVRAADAAAQAAVHDGLVKALEGLEPHQRERIVKAFGNRGRGERQRPQGRLPPGGPGSESPPSEGPPLDDPAP
jgi:uncharacterized membrane protein